MAYLIKQVGLASITFLAIFSELTAQQNLSNQGMMRVKQGTVLYVKGNFENQNGATFIQNGQMILERNWHNDGNVPQPSQGSLELRGNLISGSQDTHLYILKLNSVSGKVMLSGGSDLIIGHQLEFIEGSLGSNANNLVVFQEGASHTGADVGHYIDGPVRKNGTEDFIFPIAKNDVYKPCGLVQLSAYESFTAEYFYQSSQDGCLQIPNPEAIDTINAQGLVEMNPYEYWSIVRVGNQTAKILLYYDDTPRFDCNYQIDSLNLLMIAHYDGTDWDGLPAQAEGNLDQGTLTSLLSTNQYGIFTIGIYDGLGTVLASEPKDFYAKGRNCLLEMGWTARSEDKTAYYILEQSENGAEFKHLAQVDVRSNTVHYFAKMRLEAQSAYLRLKTVYKDGSFSYSRPIFTSVCETLGLSISPNPASESAQIKINDPELLKIRPYFQLTDGLGKVIKAGKMPENGHIDLNLKDIPSGTYVFSCQTYQLKVQVLK
ncbi:MAG: hypothetical protein NW226_23670 [Microscillaceae bacterium]|nr:hypothetical protein [Microscillaceae bacterium]